MKKNSVWKAPFLLAVRGFLHTSQPPYVFAVKNSKADYLDYLREDAWTWASFGKRGLTIVTDHANSESLRNQWQHLAKVVEADHALFETMFKRRPESEFEKEAAHAP